MQDFHTVTIIAPNSPAAEPLKRLACSSIIGDNLINSAGKALGMVKNFIFTPVNVELNMCN